MSIRNDLRQLGYSLIESICYFPNYNLMNIYQLKVFYLRIEILCNA